MPKGGPVPSIQILTEVEQKWLGRPPVVLAKRTDPRDPEPYEDHWERTKFKTYDALCPSCKALNGKLLPEGVSGRSGVRDGHVDYHSDRGITRACESQR